MKTVKKATAGFLNGGGSYVTPETSVFQMQSCSVLCASKESIELNGGFTLEQYDLTEGSNYGWN